MTKFASTGCVLVRCLLHVVVLCTLSSLALAGPTSRDVQLQCWSSADLASLPGERAITKAPQSRAPLISPAMLSVAPDSAPMVSRTAGAVRRVDLPRGVKLIALTFDFCEQPGEIAGYDGAIIDYLRQHGIKSTLFLGGKWMATHPARTEQLMSDPLFELASHGLAHRNTRLLTGVDLRREIWGPSTIYARARAQFAASQCAAPFKQTIASIPPAIKLFRFPFGACNPEGLAAADTLGLTAVQWDVSTGDPSPTQSASAIAATMVANTRPGSVVIAHANGRGHHTAAALPLAIPKLKALGYKFVTVSELLSAGTPVMSATCYDSHPGDTDKYDTLFTKPKLPQAQPLQTSPAAGAPNNGSVRFDTIPR
jgi:peptidoglycan-N-acetylglucosamine deacetylase